MGGAIQHDRNPIQHQLTKAVRGNAMGVDSGIFA
jgi:hypothetical protein